MKNRELKISSNQAGRDFRSLADALAALDAPHDVAAFLQDLCTPSEIEALSDRWKVVPMLRRGMPYREIHDRTGVSVTTIGRVARELEGGSGGYAAALEALELRKQRA